MSTKPDPKLPIPPLQSSRQESPSPLPAYSRKDQTEAPSPSTVNSEKPVFDPVVHSQAGLPHLIAYLVGQFRAHVQRTNQEIPKEEERIAGEELIERAQPLLDFFEQFLTQNRPVEIFPIDMNYGVVLDNNDRIALCPGITDIQGTMQDSGAVAISDGRSQPGQEGVVQM